MVKVYSTLFLFILIFCSSCGINNSSYINRNNADTAFYFPPQWEEQESVWLGWSLSPSIQQLHLQMIKAFDGNVGITILARSDSLLKSSFKQIQAAGVDTTKIQGYVHFIPNMFIRDAGPRFLINKQGQLAIADFGWNNYSYPTEFPVYQYSDRRGEIDNDLAKQMNLPVISTSVVGEGGGFDMSSDVLMSFKETALQRNPGRTIEDIEKEYLRVYGKKKMIWLNRMPLMDKVVAGPKAGNYFGFGANGHVDEFARFVNDSTILIALIDPAEKDFDPVSLADYEIMNENFEILKNATDVNGKSFSVIPIPTPAYKYFAEEIILTDSLIKLGNGKVLYKNNKAGDTTYFMSSVGYANFFITNGVVLSAKYWKEGLPESEKLKDEKVKNILQAAFPDRKIVQLNPLALNWNGGGMHCATQQQPKRKK
jgi:agmatine deiminase